MSHSPDQPTAARPPTKAAFAFIFITVALDMLALGVVVPLLPKLTLGFLGGDSAGAAKVTGLFGLVFAAMQFLFSPVLGALSDRYGRRPVILLSNLGLGFDYMLMALAPSLGWLFVGRAISGVTAASVPTAMAYITDVTPAEQRAAKFGMLGAAFGLGFVVGPAVGGLLSSINPRLPFWLSAGLSLANAIYGLFVLPESLPRERRSRASLLKANPLAVLTLLRSHPELLGLTAVSVLFALSHEVLPSMFVLYTHHRYHWGDAMTGVTLAAVGVCSTIVSAVLIGRIVSWLGERRTLFVGLAFGVVSFAIYGLAPTGWLFLAGLPFGALWGISGPAMQSLISRRVDPSQQGQLQGALGALRSITDMVGPVLFTQTFAFAIGPQWETPLPGAPYLLAALLLVPALYMAWRAANPGEQAAAVTPAATPP